MWGPPKRGTEDVHPWGRKTARRVSSIVGVLGLHCGEKKRRPGKNAYLTTGNQALSRIMVTRKKPQNGSVGYFIISVGVN